LGSVCTTLDTGTGRFGFVAWETDKMTREIETDKEKYRREMQSGASHRTGELHATKESCSDDLIY